MGVSVLGDSQKAGLYDNTSGALIGYVYTGHTDAVKELTEFLEWIDGDIRRDYPENSLSELYTAYKVERGFWEKNDCKRQVEKAEEELEREIQENSY